VAYDLSRVKIMTETLRSVLIEEIDGVMTDNCYGSGWTEVHCSKGGDC